MMSGLIFMQLHIYFLDRDGLLYGFASLDFSNVALNLYYSVPTYWNESNLNSPIWTSCLPYAGQRIKRHRTQ